MGFLSGKRILITGVASKLSIAYGIAKAMYKQKAELAFTYHNNKLKYRVEELATCFNSNIVIPCDVSQNNNIKLLFITLSKIWKTFDGLVHSIAFAPKNQLNGDYVNNVTQDGFMISHIVSSYSFVSMAKECRMMLNKNSALLTLSYLGADRIIPNYNVMGPAKASLEANVRYIANAMGPESVRVNAISPGPVRTLASSGIKNFREILNYCKQITPIRRTVTIEEIGNSAAFLCSDLASGITGQIIYVDGGFNISTIGKI
ncbi:SDR family oxidoreductase [Candidatus Pantoea edessiphila]|uniref:Enoyl-[acyl-carrier-protein] reductase [NADH] n=1 Tax=Candidatus Pantoea edessiphila TaxID=2044610 RepID=A0A2P5SWW5_9GAMM|nr:SDR family oxidoreductase [Candidatus Pantoea edessiphila]PPI86790.1 enoyl-[acyl-carrier-protein] reductase FabI [Candidatus Pantoea edessiphila]